MADFEEKISISKEDLKNLGIEQDLIDIVYQEVPEQVVEIERIRQIGLQLEKLIRQYINIRVIKSNKYGSYGQIKVINEENKNYVQQIMMLGTIFIFEVRQFLLKDEITFSIGGLYTDQDTGQISLAEKRLSQKEMLESIRASLSEKAIVLRGSLERFKQQDIESNSAFIQMWNQILELTDVSDFKYYKGIKTRCLIPGKKTRFYENPNADNQVWIRFVGKSHRILTYYLKNNQASFFNRGWLYEWFRAYTITEKHILNLQNSLAAGSVEPIIEKMDSVAGYKGGDYSLGQGKGSVQAKYGNDQIISFTSIIRVIFEINEILELYKSQDSQDLEIIAKKLFNLFTDKTTVDTLSLGADNTINRIISILQNKS